MSDEAKLETRRVLADIIEYRTARFASLRAAETEQQRRRVSVLETHLRCRESDERREFKRFTCSFAAQLQIEYAREGERPETKIHDARIKDVSAGGARIDVREHVPSGAVATLLLPGEYTNGKRVLLPGRIAWLGQGHLGLTFAGAPLVVGQR